MKANSFVYLISGVAAVGGLLFGYDTAVIAGAIGFLEKKFILSAAMKGWTASSALIGCIIGAAFAGMLSDLLGRKKVLLLSAVFFALSAIGTALPENLTEFVIFRLVGGVGVGIASLLSPLYIAEIAPPDIRGKLVSLNQLAIVTGMLVVYFVNAFVASLGDETWNIAVGWRWMFGSETLPALIFFSLLLAVPESPRWLLKQKHEFKAEKILAKINGREQARLQMSEIQNTLESEQGSILQLFKPGLRVALVIAIVLAIFQQITGINAILYYAPEIFKSTGAGTNAALVQTVLVGFINVVFTFVAIKLVDQLGRKALLLIGSALMTLCLFLVGGAFYLQSFSGPWILLFILIYTR